jgi:hypothetical protein
MRLVTASLKNQMNKHYASEKTMYFLLTLLFPYKKVLLIHKFFRPRNLLKLNCNVLA